MADILLVLDTLMEQIVEIAILLFEFIGVGIIIYSGLRGFTLYLKRSPATKLTLAKGLAMGLEFKLKARSSAPSSCATGTKSQPSAASSPCAPHLPSLSTGKLRKKRKSRIRPSTTSSRWGRSCLTSRLRTFPTTTSGHLASLTQIEVKYFSREVNDLICTPGTTAFFDAKTAGKL